MTCIQEHCADSLDACVTSSTEATAPALSCLQILGCIDECPSEDVACGDQCSEQGSEEGKSGILDLATCVGDAACSDMACVQDNCSGPLETCVTASVPQNIGTPLQGSAPPGSVPGDLAGTWSGARYGDTHELVLNANGTGTWTSTVTWQQYACLSYERIQSSGSVVVEGGDSGDAPYGKITIYATSVVKTERHCIPGETTTVLDPTTVELMWYRDYVRPYHEVADPNTIAIVDNACAAQYTAGGQDPGSALGMYCTYWITRH